MLRRREGGQTRRGVYRTLRDIIQECIAFDSCFMLVSTKPNNVSAQAVARLKQLKETPADAKQELVCMMCTLR